MILEFIGNAPKNAHLRFGASGNNLVDELVFVIGRKQGKNDLYEFAPKIKVSTPEDDYAEYSDDDLFVEKNNERDTIEITYTLPEKVTERGNVYMQIVFEKPIVGGEVKTWQTLRFKLTFPDSIDESDSLIKAYPNIVRELKADTKKAVDDSSAAVSIVNAAKDTADTAKSTADAAKTASDNAVATANKAKFTADSVTAAEANRVSAESARASAEAARVTAENLRSTAEGTRKTNEDARKASETARASAESARVNAENARADSEESREFAESIRTTNESARISAESTRVSSENIREDNETARGAAETARASAESSRVSAESARVEAENKRVEAENARADAEGERATAETTRANAESARVSAESVRADAESARASAESTRATNESARKTAETARASAESTRVSNENIRKDNETARGTAEVARADAEGKRGAAETARANAESARVSNENIREDNETARGTAETARASAEASRVSAESARVEAENKRAEAENARADAEGERATAETTRANAESARVSAESVRTDSEESREFAESIRTTNESARISAESTRVSSENIREDNETARGAAETARASAESSRVSAESARVEAENKRAEAENARAATLAAKLDKRSNDGKKTEAYVYNGATQSAKEVTNTPTASAIPMYNANNNLKTDKPIDPDDCVRKVDIANLIEGMDKYFAALLNDTNTTKTFKAWYNAANDGEVTRYALLERFFRMLALNNDQTHTVRFYSSAVSSDSKGTPLDWLADKKAQALATDAGVVENANSWLDADGVTRKDGEDWATENRITWYVRANALSLDDGTMDVLAIEGVDDTFDITGNLAPVYSFQLSPWYKETDDGEYLIKSWRANYAEGYTPFNNNVDFDGNPRALTWHASFGGVMTDDGTKLTSGAYRRPKNYTSSISALTLARKWNANEAVGADANAKWVLSEWQHRHFNKENSGIANGCLSYNFQHKVSVAEAGVMRVIVTTAQMSSYIVGANVIVGDNSAESAPKRGFAAAYNLSKHAVKVLSVETVKIEGTSYGAINLELDAPIITTATTWVSSAPWDTGATEDIAGNHLDGSPVSLTSQKYPLRVAGMEVLIGAYFIGIDVLYNVTANPDGGFDYAVFECRDSAKIAGSITADYIDTGIRLEGVTNAWHYVKDFVNINAPVLFPQTLGGSSTGYYKSPFRGADSAGGRSPWRFGYLNYGVALGGLACGYGYNGPSASSWSGVPWLTGAEKKRGEWLGGNA